MKRLKVLQVASFIGNIGDNANHSGARSRLQKNLNISCDFSELEIRGFFWKQWKFDESFVDKANQYDLVLIGGGNFFELWVPNSSTGTSVDISREHLDRIKTPILFHSLGIDAGMGAPEENIQKFKSFLDSVFSQENRLVSARNDGSRETAQRLLGTTYSEKILRLPDGGFFYTPPALSASEVGTETQLLGINLAGDMLDKRYEGKDNLSPDESLKEISDAALQLCETHPKLKIILFSHIYKDIGLLYKFLNLFPDSFIRSRIIFGPCLSGYEGADHIFGLYRRCSIIWGNRFHSSVCAVAGEVPVVGLVNYPQIEYLMKDLGRTEWSVDLRKAGFGERLLKLSRKALEKPEDARKELRQINRRLDSELSQGHEEVGRWLRGLKVI